MFQKNFLMIYNISNNGLTASFHSKGAELFSLKNNEKEFIWNGDPQFWGKHSPILFPIVGTLKDGTYNYENKNYSLSRHGFARDMEFEVMSKSESSIVFSLKSSSETLENYPFDFELQIKYELIANSLSVGYSVKNLSDNQMPFSIGAHPAFALKNDFKNYSLRFKNDEFLDYYLLENGLVSKLTNQIHLLNHQLQLDYNIFKYDALIIKSLASKSIEILENNVPFIKIIFEEFPNLGIWTVNNAGFICIEPWFGYSDVTTSNGNILEKEGINILEIDQNLTSTYSIEIL